LLQHLGCQVTEARNGPTALAILEGGEPVDLLFTDVMLPNGINGAQLAEAARALRPGLKVLMASGYSKEGLLPPGADSNTAVLQKPYRRNELAEVLAKLLDGRVPQP
jgi:CheY-like chemotaxis protein